MATRFTCQYTQSICSNHSCNRKRRTLASIKTTSLEATDFYPVIRGRLVAINGKDTKAEQATEEKESKNDNALNRELNLTWTQHLPPKNPIIEGQWFTGQQNEVSVEKELAARLNLKLGDTVSLQMAEGRIDAKITICARSIGTAFNLIFILFFRLCCNIILQRI